MKNDYLFAVASIRANEASLLKEADLEQLINAPDYKKAIALLQDKGWESPEDVGYSDMLDRELEKTWELIKKNAPEARALSALVVKNDFQNLKAVLKSEITGRNAEDYFVSPSVLDPLDILSAVRERRFCDLPEFISDTAEKAFDTVTKTQSGQLCDVIIDAGALKAVLSLARESGETELIEYAESFCLAADIKTAYRSMRTGKSKAFIEAALVECEGVDIQALTAACLKGGSEFFEYLKNSGLSDYGEALEKGTSAFEKYCDDRALEIMQRAKMTAFGISPVAAYYVARETEIKALRVILSAKLSGASESVIRERMRKLYV